MLIGHERLVQWGQAGANRCMDGLANLVFDTLDVPLSSPACLTLTSSGSWTGVRLDMERTVGFFPHTGGSPASEPFY